MSFSFSCLTFNCFGGLHWNTPARLRTLARWLTHTQPDLVCLQEVQSYPALNLLLRLCTSHPYRAYAPGLHAPAGALLTLARQPLLAPHFTRYTSQGAWFSLTLLDRITQKGMLCTTLAQGAHPLIVINTHLLANYRGNWTENHLAAHQQQEQLQQLARLVQSQPPDSILLVMGDFNVPRGSWLYKEFLHESGLRDVLAGDERPTYRPFRSLPARFALPIDFVFVRTPPTLSVAIVADRCFAEPLPLVGGGVGYLSDHLGVQVTLQWEG